MKTSASLLALLLLLVPSARAADCCHPEIPAAAPLPAASLYQLEVGFTDDANRSVKLVELRGRPVAITMFFSSCTYACPLIIQDLTRLRAKLPADIRDRALLVLVSFDTERDTPAALLAFRNTRKLDAQWMLLHGNDDSVRELAALLGVKFKRETDGQFAHSNLVTILSADGEIVHQRTGLRGGIDEAAAALAATAAAKP
jgi:protein SCO1/2